MRHLSDRYRRLTGVFFPGLVPIGALGWIYNDYLVPGDAGRTAANVLDHEALFGLSIAANLMLTAYWMITALVMYRLLKAVNRPGAVLMVLVAALGVPIALLTEFSQLAVLGVLHLAGGAGPTAEHVRAQALWFLEIHNGGIEIASFFNALWLLPTAYLVFRSGLVPKAIPVLLAVAGAGSLTQTLLPATVTGFDLISITGLGELAFPLWLVYRALKRRRRLGGPGGPPPLAEVVARIEEVRDSGSPAQQRTLVTGP
jgi:uncharacterized protein DUF4386